MAETKHERPIQRANMTRRNIFSPGERADIRMIDRRGALIGLGLAAAAAISSLNMPRALAAPIPKERFRKMIPEAAGRWRSRTSSELVTAAPDPFSDKLYQNLETRIYEGDGLPTMMVLLAYNNIQQNDVQVHRPEVCYPAAGFPIVSSKAVSLDFDGRRIAARKLIADRGGPKEEILYWVRVGRDFPVGWAEQRISMALANVGGVSPDGLLFRVSTIEGASGYSPDALEEFLQAFARACSSEFRDNVLF